MAEITAQLVKELRDRTGAGMMECKSALKESGGDVAEAEVILRKRGIASATKKASRATRQGVIGSYIHPGAQLGVLVEVNCESDFVARTDDFQELVHDVAMQVAASNPLWVRREEVPDEVIEREKAIYREQAKGKPDNVVEKMLDGKLNKFFQEVCLMEQPFVKDPDLSIERLRTNLVGVIGENVEVRRFVRFQLGESED